MNIPFNQKNIYYWEKCENKTYHKFDLHRYENDLSNNDLKKIIKASYYREYDIKHLLDIFFTKKGIN